MNLRQMIDMAGSILDYAPGVTAYEDEVRRFINEIYLDLYADRAWNFAQKTFMLTLKADRSVSTNAAILSSTRVKVTGGSFFTEDMAGMILEIIDNVANAGEYEILAVDLSGSPNTEAILVNKNGGAPGLIGTGSATFKVKHRYVDLPADSIDVLSLGIRSPENERQEFGYLNRWLDEHLALDVDLVSRPTDWIMDDEVTLPQPRFKPTVADAGSGTSPAAGTYDVCYTFIRQNRESAPSPVSVAVTPNTTNSINVSNLQRTDNDYLYKRVYFRGPQSNRFYRAEAADDAPSVTTTGTVSFQNINTYLVESEPLPEHEGTYKRVRMYPRQDKDYEATLRYVYRPQRLLDDSDVPEFPSEFHRYLVYRCVEELFVKHGNLPQSQMYQLKADDELMRMQQRCLTRAATIWIKQVFRQSAVYRRPRPRLTHN